MKEKYIEIMEKSLSAYTKREIEDYISEVRNKGLTEHGFPRLTANIGILISFGKCQELIDMFTEMMEICTLEMPRVKAANDFSVREICCCLEALAGKKIVSDEKLNTWKERIAGFEAEKYYSCVAPDKYTPVANWAAFSGVSDFVRGKLCGIDTSDFVEKQIATQLLSFDSKGMYKDPNNPMVYDGVTRLLLASLLNFGYKGEYKTEIEKNLEESAMLTAQMQSVSGELPFGGRSNQFIHNEAQLACLMEYYAAYFSKKGDFTTASKFKAGAVLAQNSILKYFELSPISHIKNRYDRDSLIGCEDYGYFNKYMITVASFIYLAYLLSDDGIEASTAITEEGGYIAQTSEDFHKLFLNAGGYFAELELNGDFHYDANGLGRIHKKDCPAAICLSVPFPAGEIKYKLEKENSRPMSLCAFAEGEKGCLYGSQSYAVYKVLTAEQNKDSVTCEVECDLKGLKLTESYTLSKDGVEISLSGQENAGFMLPVLHFDGKEFTEIKAQNGEIAVKYKNHLCKYTFSGDVAGEEIYCNRNGRYKVFKVKTKKVTATII